MIGKTDYELPGASREQAEFFRRVDRQIIASGKAQHDVLEPVDRKDGTTHWLLTHKLPLADAAGDIIGVLGTCEDVTERRLAEQALRDAERQFRTLADSIPQLAWMARPDGWLFWYNKRWYDYTGKTIEDMQGWGWESVHDPSELRRILPGWKAALETGEPWEDVFPLRRHDGELR